MNSYSDFIIYVDESGDHGLQLINPDYPLFVLVFCIFHKTNYSSIIVPKITDLKFKYFGHDIVILHEHDIRKKSGPFAIMNKGLRQRFLDELTDIIKAAPFTVISVVIDKNQLCQTYTAPAHPYHLAMEFGIERVHRFLNETSQEDRITPIVFECREKEDQQLELEFRRVCDGNNYFHKQLPYQIFMADKKTNSVGLQLADMIARPIGLSVLRPKQENRAMEVVKNKFYCNQYGFYNGFGLKCFP